MKRDFIRRSLPFIAVMYAGALTGPLLVHWAMLRWENRSDDVIGNLIYSFVMITIALAFLISQYWRRYRDHPESRARMFKMWPIVTFTKTK